MLLFGYDIVPVNCFTLQDIHLTSSIHGIYTVESEDKVYILQQDITNKRGDYHCFICL